MAIFILIWQKIFGSEKGPCEKCGDKGWKQYSIVDPLGPGLKIYCKKHHQEHDDARRPKCAKCDIIGKHLFNIDQFTSCYFCDDHDNMHDHFEYLQARKIN